MATFNPWMLLVILGSCAIAQTETRLEFEVASIKLPGPKSVGIFMRILPEGRVIVTNMTLKQLIADAWRIMAFQISGGPSWIESELYDISAKAEGPFKQGEAALMLQSLLIKRFQLQMQRETKELPVYALVRAEKDGKLGPSLTESSGEGCTPPDPNQLPVFDRECDFIFSRGGRQLSGRSIKLAALANVLSRRLGRLVIDKTGLTGNFDFRLEWSDDEPQTTSLQVAGDLTSPMSNSVGSSLVAAVKEQLGLKLRSEKGPVDVFIIQRAEKPSDN
jgi:uncharacterized protein (TIGR03435 family)